MQPKYKIKWGLKREANLLPRLTPITITWSDTGRQEKAYYLNISEVGHVCCAVGYKSTKHGVKEEPRKKILWYKVKAEEIEPREIAQYKPKRRKK